MTKKKIIQRYLDEYIDDIKSGKLAKKHLARIIQAENPDRFKDLESTRIMVVRLSNPDETLKGEEKHFFKSTQKIGRDSTLIKTQAKEIPDFIFPFSRPLVISDVHIPYHQENAIMAAVEFSKGKIDSVLINGDLLDCYQLSKFDKDPRNAPFADELEMGGAFISWLKQELGVPIFYKLGNHEWRWEKLMMNKAPELIGLDVFEWKGLIEHLDWGVDVIEQNQKIKFGKLNIIHGHEFKYGVYSPVNPARGIYNKAKVNTLVGHWHQESSHSESNLNKDAVTVWSTGCLCTLSPEYSPFAYTKWSHGFALLEKDDTGNFHVDNRKIVNGKVI